ncbi:MAG TPA: dihydrodipicolinate synthase family protein [Phycisphaeraceae bacterium]
MTISHEPAQIKAAHERAARRPLTRQTLHGVWPALIVPWTEQDEPDLHRFAAEVRAYEGTGVHGLYTGGTTGEFYAMDDAAFVSIAQTACDQGHQAGLPVQIGCTALSTRHVRMRVKWARQCGADGIQIALPFWLPLRDDEVLGFLVLQSRFMDCR